MRFTQDVRGWGDLLTTPPLKIDGVARRGMGAGGLCGGRFPALVALSWRSGVLCYLRLWGSMAVTSGCGGWRLR